ncbi:NADPH:quinone oxidoreductase family protein [Sneathiella glossodoripedis]|uniref:NADPH:quinone oxidoreductase family protein n=1 Tax=Sneathiella glossodoripedis TaxID=418853 RepID=UPI0004726688|nr:NADPH:quinone oxidoreductase family protein [Sneathiella glossodoripedis]
MRAIVVREFGEPAKVAKLEELDITNPGPGEVVIKNYAAGISFAMSLNIQGKYQRKAPLPYIPGSESAGVVHAVGEGVSRVKVGDRVMCNVDSGALAEYNCVRDICCHKIPGEMSFEQAATLITSYTTSYGALTLRANIKPGEWVMVLGAAGGVGLAAVEIAKALGCMVIAVAGGKSHCDTAKAHGADHVIDHRQLDFREEVLRITGGRGVDVVYDSIGGDATIQSIRSLAWEGKLLTIGYASGTIPDIPANRLLLKNASVMGFNMGHYYGWAPGVDRAEHSHTVDAMISGVLELFSDGHLRPEIGAVYTIDQFQEALAAVINRKVDGKCILRHEHPED